MSSATQASPSLAPSRWEAAPTPAAAADLEAAGLPTWLAALLARREVMTAAEAERFLSPSIDQLHDPERLAGLPEAVERLAAARERGEKVAVVGDYDVDGVTSTALLLAVFRARGLDAVEILPHRLREGYGFQPVHVERARESGCGLVVTADCGVSSLAAAEAAREAGIDVIVTDHHLPGARTPAGAILVNPRQAGCDYPFPDLAGVGLALKLALATAKRLGREMPVEPLLRIACLGTVADLVPLTGENRVIAALGLAALGRTRSPGLKALMRRAGVRGAVSASDVGFRIGPRINAAGRLDDAAHALELLLTRDARRADQLAEDLDGWNRARQDEEARVVEEAREELLARSPLPPIAVLCREGWHKGVVGIAAGRIAREFCRPALLLAPDGDSATGSGRSVPGIALHRFLARWEGDLERFGGHAQAVGLTVGLARLAELTRVWEEQAGSEWPAELLARRYEYELAVAPGEAAGGLLEGLSRLEPTGQGNPQPLLRVGPMSLAFPPRIFGKAAQHLSAVARGDDGARLALVGWRWAERAAGLEGRFEALGYLEEDRYRGGPVLRLVDARPFGGATAEPAGDPAPERRRPAGS